jgi:aminopeptidase N
MSEARDPVYLKNYLVPEFLIESTDLHFELDEEKTIVTNKMLFTLNPKSMAHEARLSLMGENLELLEIQLNGRTLTANDYTLTDKLLVLPVRDKKFELLIRTQIYPQKNLAFEGLYKSGGMFCTQCEAEGFRKITYFLDRPDVMTKYLVSITADAGKYPLLLSNGNLIEKKSLPGGRHFAKWQDPFKKPSYLFALVAGDLGLYEDHFITRSGRQIKLQIFSHKGYENRCVHAMDSLKKAMKWDEDVFGLEYDLDIFMIVAVDDFNMGAMENKGLNVFNSKYILSNAETATDFDYETILAIIGHEYFHNWTGNRVTCRDWFQLSLKEGLTVFRDQEFSSTVFSRAVKRVEDVIRLRSVQFAEDAGPMAHPVRPQSFIEINNFYTPTVYEKGAEVIRMIHTIIGAVNFRKGMDKYFELFDGQAVTTEDFVRAMELVSGEDLTQFKNWYDQAGTPEVLVTSEYFPSTQTFELKMKQSCPPTPGQVAKKDFHIPVAFSLLAADGREILAEQVLHLKQKTQVFTFKNIEEKPIASLLRGFSAPVKLEYEYSDSELSFLMAHDSDSFNRWEAAQKLFSRTFIKQVEAEQSHRALEVSPELIHAVKAVLNNQELDPQFKSLLLSFPSETYLTQFFENIDVEAITQARQKILMALAKSSFQELEQLLQNITAKLSKMTDKNYSHEGSGLRSLKNACLKLICHIESEKAFAYAVDQFMKAQNMTEEIGALQALNAFDSKVRGEIFKAFYEKWKKESLVINKWLSLQAACTSGNSLGRVQAVSIDPVFDKNNPNKIFDLFYRFGYDNLAGFHDKSGKAYSYMVDQILDIDSRNPQVAARLVSVFNHWKKFDDTRKDLMRVQINRIVQTKNLSNNVFEIASRALN